MKYLLSKQVRYMNTSPIKDKLNTDLPAADDEDPFKEEKIGQVADNPLHQLTQQIENLNALDK